MDEWDLIILIWHSSDPSLSIKVMESMPLVRDQLTESKTFIRDQLTILFIINFNESLSQSIMAAPGGKEKSAQGTAIESPRHFMLEQITMYILAFGVSFNTFSRWNSTSDAMIAVFWPVKGRNKRRFYLSEKLLSMIREWFSPKQGKTCRHVGYKAFVATPEAQNLNFGSLYSGHQCEQWA